MVEEEPDALKDLGTRLEWVYPVERDADMDAALAPLYRVPEDGNQATA